MTEMEETCQIKLKRTKKDHQRPQCAAGLHCSAMNQSAGPNIVHGAYDKNWYTLIHQY